MGLPHKEKWLVECKHLAVSNRSVKETDIGNFETRMKQHGVNRYLLITSTLVSETVKNQLQAVTEDQSSSRMAIFWTKHDLVRFLEENPTISQRYLADFERQAFKAINMINKHYYFAHRGAFLWCTGISALFENRAYYKEAINADDLRRSLEQKGIEELASSKSDDGETWLILVRSSSAKELDDLIWGLCPGDAEYISIQRQEALQGLWPFYHEPVNRQFQMIR